MHWIHAGGSLKCFSTLSFLRRGYQGQSIATDIVMLLSHMVLYCIFCKAKHDQNLMQQVNTAKDFLPDVTELENLVAK